MRSSITEAHVVAVMDDGNGGQRLHFFEDDVSLEQDIERPFDTDIGVEKFGIEASKWYIMKLMNKAMELIVMNSMAEDSCRIHRRNKVTVSEWR